MSDETGRRRPMQRLGDLLPDVARRLGVEDELRLARAAQTWAALVAERVPPAAGACRLVEVGNGRLLVEADHPIVAQELRLRSGELLEAFATAPWGAPAGELQVRVRRSPPPARQAPSPEGADEEG